MFKGKCNASKVWKIILIVWIVFATIYVIIGEYNRIQNFVAQRAYNAGLTTAVTEIIKQSENCQPVPVNVDELSAQLINLDCLQQPEEAEE